MFKNLIQKSLAMIIICLACTSGYIRPMEATKKQLYLQTSLRCIENVIWPHKLKLLKIAAPYTSPTELLQYFQNAYKQFNENVEDAADTAMHHIEQMCPHNLTVSAFLLYNQELLFLAVLMDDLVSIKIICHLAGDVCPDMICKMVFVSSSALFHAIETENNIIIEEFFKHGGQKMLYCDTELCKPLTYVIRIRKHTMAELLINKADAKVKELLFYVDSHGENALHKATELHYYGDKFDDSKYKMLEIILKAAGTNAQALASSKNKAGSIAFDTIENEYENKRITEETYNEFKKLFEKYNALQ